MKGKVKVHLTVQYVPLPPEKKAAYEEAMRLLLAMLRNTQPDKDLPETRQQNALEVHKGI